MKFNSKSYSRNYFALIWLMVCQSFSRHPKAFRHNPKSRIIKDHVVLSWLWWAKKQAVKIYGEGSIFDDRSPVLEACLPESNPLSAVRLAIPIEDPFLEQNSLVPSPGDLRRNHHLDLTKRSGQPERNIGLEFHSGLRDCHFPRHSGPSLVLVWSSIEWAPCIVGLFALALSVE